MSAQNTPEQRANRDKQLAVLLRQAQWLLDDTAYDLPSGRCTAEDRESLATMLFELASSLREDKLPPAMVDAEQVEQ